MDEISQKSSWSDYSHSRCSINNRPQIFSHWCRKKNYVLNSNNISILNSIDLESVVPEGTYVTVIGDSKPSSEYGDNNGSIRSTMRNFKLIDGLITALEYSTGISNNKKSIADTQLLHYTDSNLDTEVLSFHDSNSYMSVINIDEKCQTRNNELLHEPTVIPITTNSVNSSHNCITFDQTTIEIEDRTHDQDPLLLNEDHNIDTITDSDTIHNVINVLVENHHQDNFAQGQFAEPRLETNEHCSQNIVSIANELQQIQSNPTSEVIIHSSNPVEHNTSVPAYTIPSYDSVLRSDAQQFIAQQFRTPMPFPVSRGYLHHPVPYRSFILPPPPPRILNNNSSPIGAYSLPVPYLNCATSPSVQLTRWRIQSEFDNSANQCPTSLQSNRAHDSNTGNCGIGNNVSHILSPEDLPRLFPNYMPPPFLIDDEREIDDPKGCCGHSHYPHATLIRWFIAIISTIGISCIIVGIVLGALTVSGSTRLTLCLLMIGVGLVLIIVSVIAWRLTMVSRNNNRSCCTIFPFQSRSSISAFPERRSRSRYFRAGRNANHPHPSHFDPFSADFPWRPPPPTYQATIQECRLQQFLETRRAYLPPGASPPPTYRSHHVQHINRLQNNNNINSVRQEMTEIESSSPPSYRSRESSNVVCSNSVTEINDNDNHGRSGLNDTVEDLSGDHQLNEVIATTETVAHDDQINLIDNKGSKQYPNTFNQLDKENNNNNNHIRRRSYSTSSNTDRDNNSSISAIIEVRNVKSSPLKRHHDNKNSNNNNNNKISVIDCSQVIPVGFEVVGDPNSINRNNSNNNSNNIETVNINDPGQQQEEPILTIPVRSSHDCDNNSSSTSTVSTVRSTSAQARKSNNKYSYDRNSPLKYRKLKNINGIVSPKRSHQRSRINMNPSTSYVIERSQKSDPNRPSTSSRNNINRIVIDKRNMDLPKTEKIFSPRPYPLNMNQHLNNNIQRICYPIASIQPAFLSIPSPPQQRSSLSHAREDSLLSVSEFLNITATPSYV